MHLHYVANVYFIPVAMVLSTLIPIANDKNDMQNPGKYRGIALGVICT